MGLWDPHDLCPLNKDELIQMWQSHWRKTLIDGFECLSDRSVYYRSMFVQFTDGKSYMEIFNYLPVHFSLSTQRPVESRMGTVPNSLLRLRPMSWKAVNINNECDTLMNIQTMQK